MVGQWSKLDGLLPEQEFETKIKKWWTWSRKRKASVILLDGPPSKIPAVHVDSSSGM